MDTVIFFALILGGIAFWMYLRRRQKYSDLPPGPPGVPYFGNLFQLNHDHPCILLSEWAAKYGNIYTMWTFNKPVVVVSGFESIWETYVSKSTDFAGRVQQYSFSYCTLNSKDINIADYSQDWVRRKKIFMTSLKMYGEGLKHLEDLMVDIIAELVEDIEATKQQPFNPQIHFQLALANVLSLLYFGSKFERNDPEFLQLVEFVSETPYILRQSVVRFLFDTFPWLHYFPLKQSKLLTEHVERYMKNWIPQHIKKAKEKYDRNNCMNMMDALLKQQEDDIKSGAQYPLEDDHLIAVTRNFFGGGMNTSTSSLTSLFAVLTDKQELQDKAREEVDHVLQGRYPTIKDRESMPYIQALLEEVLRYTVVVVFTSHKATKDSSLCGYFIPKGTEIFPNMWHLCHDDKFWKNPYDFDPERFLDKDGQMLPVDHPNMKRLLVFGGGRRVCPGEQMARVRLFLIITSLLQKFIFKPVADDQPPVHDPRTFRFSGIVKPKPYNLVAIPRN